MSIRRKKICPKCGRKLWMKDFYSSGNGYRSALCKECILEKRREEYQKKKAPDGRYIDPNSNRIMERKEGSSRIYWSENMLTLLKRHYHNTTNQELSELLEVSQRTIARKAKELNLEKDEDFMNRVRKENLLFANARNKEMCYPNSFSKRGLKFKGNQYTKRIKVED